MKFEKAGPLPFTLKPRADVTRSPKEGYQWPHKKGLMSFKLFFLSQNSSIQIMPHQILPVARTALIPPVLGGFTAG